MKKIKYLLFLLPFLFTLNVYATEYNISSKIKYNVSLPGGSYGADDINDGYNTIMGRYSVGTRYNGRIGYMEFFVDGESFNASINHTYTITLNMATNDWRNNFMGPIVSKCNSDGSVQTTNYHLVVSNFRFISRKQIKFNFKTNSTLSPYYKFVLYSNNYANKGGTAITGETNWNLSSIIISDNTSSGGGSSGTTPTPTPTPSASNKDIIDNANQNTDDIINNNNQNTTDIIDNANHNSQDIIDNQNKNQEQTNQLLGQCFTNIYNLSHIENIYNFLNNNGVFVQKTADSNNSPNLKLQFFNNSSYVSTSSYLPRLSIGRFKFDFTKNSNFNYISFGVNGSQIDTLIKYDVSYLKDNHDYSLIFDITNATQGSITLEKIMITDKVTYLLPYIAYNETTCNSKLDSVGQSVVNGAQSIIDNVNNGNQQINDNLNNIKDSLTDETTPEINLDLNLDTSSPVSDLLTMPLTILNKIFNITDDTCQPYVLPFDFTGGNNTLTLPCIDLKKHLGNSVYNILDTILCFYLCYQIGMFCISIYEDITSLRDGFDSLYTPKHHNTSTRVGRGELEGKY